MMVNSLCGSGLAKANPRFAPEVSRSQRQSLCLGGMNIPVKLIEQLVEFWRHQLENENNRRRFVDGQFGPAHDIPYEELRRLVALRERKLQS